MVNIYLISDEHNRVKIGTCRGRAQTRANTLQTGNADQLTVLGVLRAARVEDERRLHDQFAHLRVRGEWFTLHPDILRAFHLVTGR